MSSSELELELKISPTFPDLPPYRIGVIGAGFIVRGIHLTAYAEAGFNVTAIAPRTPEHAAEVAYQSAATGRVARPAAFLSEASSE